MKNYSVASAKYLHHKSLLNSNFKLLCIAIGCPLRLMYIMSCSGKNVQVLSVLNAF